MNTCNYKNEKEVCFSFGTQVEPTRYACPFCIDLLCNICLYGPIDIDKFVIMFKNIYLAKISMSYECQGRMFRCSWKGVVTGNSVDIGTVDVL